MVTVVRCPICSSAKRIHHVKENFNCCGVRHNTAKHTVLINKWKNKPEVKNGSRPIKRDKQRGITDIERQSVIIR